MDIEFNRAGTIVDEADSSGTIANNNIGGAGGAGLVAVLTAAPGGALGLTPTVAVALDIRSNFVGLITNNDVHNATVGVNYAVPAQLIGNRIFTNATGIVMPVNSTSGGLGYFPGSGRNEIYANTTGVNLTGRMQNQYIHNNATRVAGSGIG